MKQPRLFCLLVSALLSASSALVFSQNLPGRVRTYYIAADEVEWDYAPGGVNKMMGMKFEGYSKVFTERGPHRIGTVYRKALYREYTDDTFYPAQAAVPRMGAHRDSRAHPARGSRRHNPRGL